jgi:hypothetical protein
VKIIIRHIKGSLLQELSRALASRARVGDVTSYLLTCFSKLACMGGVFDPKPSIELGPAEELTLILNCHLRDSPRV